MPVLLPNTTTSSAGDTDQIFISRLRDFIEDPPLFYPESFAPNGSATEYRASGFPIWDNDTKISIKVDGTVQNIIDNRQDLTSANQVAIDYETGWMFWNTAPSGTTCTVRKSKVRWRDKKLLEALYAGLKVTFPLLWQYQSDTSITTAVNQWEYTLPTVFYDPRVRIMRVQIQEIPAALERFHDVVSYKVGQNTLHIPNSQEFTIGSVVRVQYAGPYQTLADLEPQAQQLPLLYAKGYLLSNKEISRVRQDTANVTASENANPIGASQNAGAYFFSLFEQELKRLARPMPMQPLLSRYGR